MIKTTAASLAGIFCTPTGDETGHPLLWDTYKGESLNGASSNKYLHRHRRAIMAYVKKSKK